MEVWNDSADPRNEDGETIRGQFLVYVDSARATARARKEVSRYYIALQAAEITAAAALVRFTDLSSNGVNWFAGIGVAALTGQCMLWWASIRSHHQQAAVKWRVIKDIEARLPIRPFTVEHQLGYVPPNTWLRYLSLNRIERGVPLALVALYLSALLVIVLF